MLHFHKLTKDDHHKLALEGTKIGGEHLPCENACHSLAPKDLNRNFKILKKCKNKFDCLIYEMFFIHDLRPSLNVQTDSIRAKVFK